MINHLNFLTNILILYNYMELIFLYKNVDILKQMFYNNIWIKYKNGDDLLDNMGSDELIANLFRISQTEQRLKRDKVDTEKQACDTHNKIGKIVRKAIKEAGRNYARRFTYS